MNTFLPQHLRVLDEGSIIKGRNSSFGSFPDERSLENHTRLGIINLDKHAGPTSHEIVSIVKKILNIDKAGHSGTLDPNVTGVLPIALLDATKILSTLLLAPKQYICNMQTNLIADVPYWEKIFDNFRGEIFQVPPIKSNVVRRLRKRTIYDLQVLEVLEKNVLFSVTSEAGTYIRTLCTDLGRVSGNNSFMKELRRVKTAHFDELEAITLHQLFDAYADFKEGKGEGMLREKILPIEVAVKHLPVIVLRENAVDPVCHGADLTIPGVIAYTDFTPNQIISLRTPKGELVAIGPTYLSSKSLEIQARGKIFHPDKVVMKRGTYPEYSK